MTIENQDDQKEIDVTPIEARGAQTVNWQTRVFFISTIAAAIALGLFLVHPGF